MLRDELNDTQMGHITEVMYQLLHKATSTGQISGALSMVGQIAKMPEYLEAQRSAADAGAAKRGRDRKRSSEPPATPVKKKKKVAAPATPPSKKDKKGGRFPDTEGAEGPNSLPRMKGGNPAGSPCKDLADDGKSALSRRAHSRISRPLPSALGRVSRLR